MENPRFKTNNDSLNLELLGTQGNNRVYTTSSAAEISKFYNEDYSMGFNAAVRKVNEALKELESIEARRILGIIKS